MNDLAALFVLVLALIKIGDGLAMTVPLIRARKPVFVGYSVLHDRAQDVSPPLRTLLRGLFWLPTIIAIQVTLLFVADAADPTLLILAATATVCCAGNGMVSYLVAVTLWSPPPADSMGRGVHPLAVILGVTASLITAYAALYHVVAVASSAAFTDGGRPVEALGFVDSLYFSAVTMATVGYGDISAHGDGARLAVVTQLALGITTLAVFLTSVVQRERI